MVFRHQRARYANDGNAFTAVAEQDTYALSVVAF